MRHFTGSIIFAFFISMFAISQAFAVPRGYSRSPVLLAVDNDLNIRKNRTVPAETSKIMSVLEDRIVDPEVLAKTRDKVHTLSDEEIRLVSSLCERIATGERTARADIVFSLVTALIVLS
ncbi:MAG: hypothetical protein ACYC9M_05920 [Desulfobulbaceae bacterium]